MIPIFICVKKGNKEWGNPLNNYLVQYEQAINYLHTLQYNGYTYIDKNMKTHKQSL